MTSDYVDNWDGLPPVVQDVLLPILTCFDEAADLLFDRRLNLSFEAAVKELSIPGVVALTEGLRALRDLLSARVSVEVAGEGRLLFDGVLLLTVYDLPLYTPCVYLSQLAQFMDGQNVRVWKETTAVEIVEILGMMARFVPTSTETARVVTAALHDMMYLYPGTQSMAELILEREATFPNAAAIMQTALQLVRKR